MYTEQLYIFGYHQDQVEKECDEELRRLMVQRQGYIYLKSHDEGTRWI